MHAKSPAAYQFMKKVLVLPSARTLRLERNKYSPVAAGLQMAVVERIKEHVEKVCEDGDNHQRMVVLAFDEMTIKGIWFIKLIYCDYMLNLISRHLTIEFRGQNTLSKYIN